MGARVVSGAVAAAVALAVLIAPGVSAEASPVADRGPAASALVVSIGSNRTAQININGSSYTGSSYDKVTVYPSKCVVKLLDRNGHRILFSGRVATGSNTVDVKKAKIKKGRIDVDIRASCPKKTVKVRDDGDPYRVVFTRVHASIEGITHFDGIALRYFG
jgi:hypothetical protein